ncbi:hypothetical protein [Prevotella sp. KH2C16]|uniref:hypothetical protein n=1 Tax=Prevotella sp. KH2C16 TaxID=1855325 RepID=UPI001160A7A9|nr:hypothetical protein [Prevotella sp. KH2C16]
MFTEIERDADRFLEKHPDAETFIPDEKDGQAGHDGLLQLMTLLHNGHVNEARNIILQAKAEAFGCMLQAEHGSSHDYILRWIDRIQA